MSAYIPPTVKRAALPLLSWATSLSLHAALAALLVLNGGLRPAVTAGKAPVSETTTAAGRASRLADAHAKLEKLQQIEKSLENLAKKTGKAENSEQKRDQAESPTGQVSAATKGQSTEALQAQTRATEAQQAAVRALKTEKADPQNPLTAVPTLRSLAKVAISLQQAKEAQAKAAVMQEQLKRTIDKGRLPEPVKTTLAEATRKQEEARAAQQQAEAKLQQARAAATKAAVATPGSSSTPPMPSGAPDSHRPETASPPALNEVELATRLAAKAQADAKSAQERVSQQLQAIDKQVTRSRQQTSQAQEGVQNKPVASPPSGSPPTQESAATKGAATSRPNAAPAQATARPGGQPRANAANPKELSGGQNDGKARPERPSGQAARPASGQSGQSGQRPADLATAYQSAQATQERIANAYRDVRAAQLARIEGISVEEAKQRTDTVPFTSAPLPLGPGAKLSTERAAQQEMAAMVARGQRLLDQAQRRTGTDAGALLAQMRRSARQDNGPRADMTPFMATDRPADNGDRPPMPGDPSYLPPPPAPAVTPDLVKKVSFGRRIAANGASDSDWLAIDTWYTVGPFPNPARQNINTAYPPEAAVDLDAEYTGKDGRKVRWQFVQASRPDVVPVTPEEYGVYYAYTELWLDAPRDLWIAVGSDDKSTLWIENQLVWLSSDVLKGWQIGEGLRYVHFKQGRNRILLRCENGWRGVAFSMILALKTPSGYARQSP